MSSSLLSKIPDVRINPEGESKYILCKIFNKKEEKLVVRADADAEFHLDILKPLKEDMTRIGLDVKCSGDDLGGGRIYVDSENKIITFWGKSNALGKASHNLAGKIIKKSFPDFEILIDKAVIADDEDN